MNYTKTFMLIAALTALFGVIGYAIAGVGGMLIALLIAGGMNVFAYWNSDKSVLKHFQAQPVTQSQMPWLYNMVADLAHKGNMPVPKVYIMNNPQPNAFATGRDPEHAAVAVTSGIIDILSKQELAGVIAHELAHIQNRDTLIMTITATIAGAISTLTNIATFSSMFGGNNRSDGTGKGGGLSPIIMIAVSMLAPLAASVVQMTISRTREYAADRMGAQICGDPIALADALEKIEQAVRGGQHRNQPAEKNQAMAHLFIINPLFGKKGDALFSTHPNTQNRIAELHKLAQNMPKKTLADSYDEGMRQHFEKKSFFESRAS
ncbi:MAG: heat shock protein HtpX [Alphaproteobacteria bacterium]|jgi:heat shock protein HtpX